MGKFNEYTQKATPADNDTLMIYDATSKSNKLSPFSGIWNWIVEKLTNAVIANLQTDNRTVLGAINELNSNSFSTYETGDASQVILPVNGGGAIVMIAYALGGYGNDGEATVMALFRYNYEGTECSIDYIYNRGNIIIEKSVSNYKNTIVFKTQDESPVKYLKIKTFNI
jgi:hypothetical protein